MKVVLLRDDSNKQAATHFWECRGDLSKYTPDNTTYVWSLGSYIQQQFTTTIKESVRAHLTLVHVFHAIPLQAIHGWPIHYSGLHHCMYGGIASGSVTITATKFTGSHKSRASGHVACTIRWQGRQGVLPIKGHPRHHHHPASRELPLVLD
jgi:hypothetical protein